MSDQQLSLPESVYEGLLAAAATEGVTPADWIAAHLPSRLISPSQQQSLYDVLQDVAGSIGAGDEPSPQNIKAAVGDAITAKLAKQGFQSL